MPSCVCVGRQNARIRPWALFLERPRVFCCRKNHLNRCPSSSCLTHPSHSIIMLASMDNDDDDDDKVSGGWGAASLVAVDDSVVSCRCPSSGVVRDWVVANETTAPHSSSSSFLNGSGRAGCLMCCSSTSLDSKTLPQTKQVQASSSLSCCCCCCCCGASVLLLLGRTNGFMVVVDGSMAKK